MNEFGDLKYGTVAEDILRFNGESVLLLDQKRKRNLRCGKPYRADCFLSWYTPGTLKDATLRDCSNCLRKEWKS
jgi:hypothetical protein